MKEVLSKITQKPTLLDQGPTQSPLQECLEQLSMSNRRLAAHLPDMQSSALPTIAENHGCLEFRMMIESSAKDAADVTCIRVTGFKHVCRCERTVYLDKEIFGHSSSSTSDMNTPPSTANVAVAGKMENRRLQHVSVEIRSAESLSDQANLLLDSLSIESCRERDEDGFVGGGIIPLTVQQFGRVSNPMTQGVLLKHITADLDQRMRLEMAFHLSSVIILLASNNLPQPSWDCWAIAFEQGVTKGCYAICLKADKPRSDAIIGSQKHDSEKFAVMAQDLTLTLLGMRLTELALGQTLAEVRLANSYIFAEAKTHDLDILDLLTVKRVLSQRLMRAKVGAFYEDVVTICIHQQYRSKNSSNIQRLSSTDKSFLEDAAITILHPLYREICKYFE